jgi:O-antigen/teichoic acid export membrane protein
MTTRDIDLDVVDPPEESPAMSSARVRFFWTFADQGLSSLTNAALAIMVARTVDRSDFGAFSLALVTFGFVVGLVRAFVGEPFVVRFSAVDDVRRLRATSHATGTAISLGLLASVVCLPIAAVAGGPTGLAFAALAISLPGLMLQDTWRHLFFAAGRPRAATVNDLIWALLQFVLLGTLFVRGIHSIFWITLAWGVSALVAAVAGAWQTGVTPAPLAAFTWLRETRALNLRLAIGYTLNMGSVNLATYAVSLIVGVVAVGALRAAQVVLGPLNLLFAGFNAFVLPLLARRVAARQRLLRPAVVGSAALVLVTAPWVAIMLLIPGHLGHAVLGDSWPGARQVMLPSGLLMLASALVLGASNSLVALSRADLILRLTLVQAPLILLLGTFGGWRWGAVGAAYGFAAAQGVGLVICWALFVRADARARPDARSPG